jgi:aminoglycoside 6-adenylyltransferase
MTDAENLIKTIKKWAQSQDSIRSVILYGARVKKGSWDKYSDINLALFATELLQFEQKNWTHAFAPVWLAVTQQKDETLVHQVIYEGGLRVNFRIYPAEKLTVFTKKLPLDMQSGYQVLLDKDKQTRGFPKAIGVFPKPTRPSPEMFQVTLESFWMTAHSLAKYLWRGDLWRVKHYDWQLKQHLLQMMGWHAHVCRGKVDFTTEEGAEIKEWTDPDTYISLMTVFGRFYPADSWRALEETIRRFNTLSEAVAQSLNTDNRPELTKHFTAWLDTLKNTPE